jgi:hypothetical protein
MADSWIKYSENMDPIEFQIIDGCYDLMNALKKNYENYLIRIHEQHVTKDNRVEYNLAKIDEIKKGKHGLEFTIESGTKYHKILMHQHGNQSVHCFVNMKTGDVYKAASWKSPASGARFNLLQADENEWLMKNADWCGMYLYRNYGRNRMKA